MAKDIERIAILGGTFDPVHFGHIAMARRVMSSGRFGRLIVVPANLPPHKSVQNAFVHRFDMAKLAFCELAQTEVSDIEARLQGRQNYSLDVLRALRSELGDVELTLVIGGDSLQDLGSWHEPEMLLQEFRLAVLPRFGADFTLNILQTKWGNGLGRRLFDSLLDAPLFEISSTELRKKLEKGENTANFIPENVRNYIAAHQLYYKD